MYTQKIFQAGNSAVVAIPKDLLRKLNLKTGSSVTIKSSPDESHLMVGKPMAPSKSVKKTASEKEFKNWLNQVLDEDSEILDELARH